MEADAQAAAEARQNQDALLELLEAADEALSLGGGGMTPPGASQARRQGALAPSRPSPPGWIGELCDECDSE